MVEFKTEPFETHYDLYEELGSGHFAIVRRARERRSGQDFAAKIIKKKKQANSKRGAHIHEIQKEIHILSLLDHPNCIFLHDVYETLGEVILVLELVSGGELFDHISEREYLSEAEAAAFIRQILEGVAHMHGKNIAHLDLKPENIMLVNKNSSRIKLIDMGLAEVLTPNADKRKLMGTAEFVAPEVINFESISLATDMWSIGVITYILLSGCSPFLGEDQQETYRNIIAVDYTFDEEFFPCTSELAKDFIKSLFEKDPKKRASVWECLRHAWIQPPEGSRDLRSNSNINMSNFKNFNARRKWQEDPPTRDPPTRDPPPPPSSVQARGGRNTAPGSAAMRSTSAARAEGKVSEPPKDPYSAGGSLLSAGDDRINDPREPRDNYSSDLSMIEEGSPSSSSSSSARPPSASSSVTINIHVQGGGVGGVGGVGGTITADGAAAVTTGLSSSSSTSNGVSSSFSSPSSSSGSSSLRSARENSVDDRFQEDPSKLLRPLTSQVAHKIADYEKQLFRGVAAMTESLSQFTRQIESDCTQNFERLRTGQHRSVVGGGGGGASALASSSAATAASMSSPASALASSGQQQQPWERRSGRMLRRLTGGGGREDGGGAAGGAGGAGGGGSIGSTRVTLTRTPSVSRSVSRESILDARVE